MTDIVHQLMRYMAAQLTQLDLWDACFAVCFVSQDGDAKQVELYPYIDAPNPDPLIVSPTDEFGTYIYIREVDPSIDGSIYEYENESSCPPTGASVKKRFRAVAVTSNYCFPVELVTMLSINIQDVNFSGFTRYAVEDVGIEYVGETAGMRTLFEEETGVKPKSNDIEMAAFDFDLTFNYNTSCSEDELPNLC